MFTIAGGILIAALVLAAVGLICMLVSHWFGTAPERARQKQWEAEMRAKHTA